MYSSVLRRQFHVEGAEVSALRVFDRGAEGGIPLLEGVAVPAVVIDNRVRDLIALVYAFHPCRALVMAPFPEILAQVDTAIFHLGMFDGELTFAVEFVAKCSIIDSRIPTGNFFKNLLVYFPQTAPSILAWHQKLAGRGIVGEGGVVVDAAQSRIGCGWTADCRPRQSDDPATKTYVSLLRRILCNRGEVTSWEITQCSLCGIDRDPGGRDHRHKRDADEDGTKKISHGTNRLEGMTVSVCSPGFQKEIASGEVRGNLSPFIVIQSTSTGTYPSAIPEYLFAWYARISEALRARIFSKPK